MNVELLEFNEFIPEWNNNKGLPEHEQIKIKWHHPSTVELKQIRRMNNPKMSMDPNSRDANDISVELIVDYISAVKILIDGIENLSLRGKPIKTGKALIDARGLTKLVDEITTFFMNEMELEEEELKNS